MQKFSDKQLTDKQLISLTTNLLTLLIKQIDKNLLLSTTNNQSLSSHFNSRDEND